MLNTEKMTFSIDEFAKVSNTCRDKLYAAIHKGALTVRRSGRRTLILREDAQAYLASLPKIDPKDLKQPVAKRRRAEHEARPT